MTPHATFNTPPIDTTIPAHPQLWMTVLFGLAALLAVGFATTFLVRRRDPLPLALVVGGAVSFILEPEFAVLSQRWFPGPGAWTVFTVYDRSFPVFQLLADIALVGGVIAYAYVQLSRDSSRDAVWRLFVIEAVVLAALEIAPVATGTSIWFGLHPTAAFNVPLWVPISKAAVGIGVAAAIRLCLPRLTSRSRVLLLLLVPTGIGALQAAVCWPVWIALGAQWGTLANLGASLLVIALSILTVHVVATNTAASPVVGMTPEAKIVTIGLSSAAGTAGQ